MTTRPIILALVVAVLLAGVALWIVQSNRSGPTQGPGDTLAPGEPVITAQAIDVVRIHLVGDGVRDHLVRTALTSEQPGAWVARVGTSPDDAANDWPADSPLVEQWLLALRQVTAVGTPEPGAEAGPERFRLTIAYRDGRERTIVLGPGALGGREVVRVEEGGRTRTALIDTSLRSRLVSAGDQRPLAIRAMRSRSVIADALSATRIELTTPAGALELRREGRQWRMIEPVKAPADPTGVMGLQNALEQLRVERFFDEGEPEEGRAAMNQPRAQVRVVRTARLLDADGSVTSRVDEHTLMIGGPADPASRTVWAVPAYGRRVVTLAASSLPALFVDPARVVSPHASSALVADVQSLRIMPSPDNPVERVNFVRRGDAWEEHRSERPPVLLTPEQRVEIAATLQFVTQAPAQSIQLLPPPGMRELAVIELLGSDGAVQGGLDDVPGSMIVGYLEGSPTPVVIRTGNVHRLYNSVPRLLTPVFAVVAPGQTEPPPQAPEK